MLAKWQLQALREARARTSVVTTFRASFYRATLCLSFFFRYFPYLSIPWDDQSQHHIKDATSRAHTHTHTKSVQRQVFFVWHRQPNGVCVCLDCYISYRCCCCCLFTCIFEFCRCRFGSFGYHVRCFAPFSLSYFLLLFFF